MKYASGLMIQNEIGNILLLRRKDILTEPGRYGLVGGWVDHHEPIPSQLVAKMSEEIGFAFDMSAIRFAKEYLFDFHEPSVTFYLYVVQTQRKHLEKFTRINTSKHSDMMWLSLSEALLRPDLMEGMYQILHDLPDGLCLP